MHFSESTDFSVRELSKGARDKKAREVVSIEILFQGIEIE